MSNFLIISNILKLAVRNSFDIRCGASLLCAVLVPHTFAPISVERNVLAMRAHLHTILLAMGADLHTILLAMRADLHTIFM